MGMVKVQLDGLAMDVVSNSPVVILTSKELKKVLPIWIGHNEAWAIAMEITGMGSKRPLTHDLFKNTLDAMGGTLERVEVTELKEQTFYARLQISYDGKQIHIDSRPSDSIALALKAKCPIYVNEDLFQIKQEETPEQGPPIGDPESLKDRLKRIDPEDFGKYSL